MDDSCCFCANKCYEGTTVVINEESRVTDQARAYFFVTPPIVTRENLEFGAKTRCGCRAKSHEVQGPVRMILYQISSARVYYF